MKKRETVELGVRDKWIDKILLIVHLFLAAATVLLLVFLRDLGYGAGYFVLLLLVLAVNLVGSGFSLVHLLSPSVAIEGNEDGVFVHGLFRSYFYSFAEIEYASHREATHKYRNHSLILFRHREELNVGKVYVMVSSQKGLRKLTFFRIINASFVANWINDEKAKQTTSN